ncbi:MAG: fumarylacetoacetate hydrolase family protein [Alphaproteobacteria bacterium]|nr:fumarylacetoacetate hydrolase family protein [Alphaproteobacteria bacterium]
MDQTRAACELLYRHWADGTQLESLPPDLRPATQADGYRVQSHLESFTAAPLYGWKIAATSINGQRHIGVDGPLAGRILAERVIADGGNFTLGTSLMRVAELEFAFRMGADLAPRADEYTQDEVLSAVATLHPAIELPDSRFAHFETAGLAQLVADNACAHFFVLGAATDADWRGLDLAAHPGKAFRNGALAEEGVGANVLGDPRIALTWLANELSRHGMTLKAGQVVTTGTCVKPLVIAVGDHIEGDLGVLGRVSVRIT